MREGAVFKRGKDKCFKGFYFFFLLKRLKFIKCSLIIDWREIHQIDLEHLMTRTSRAKQSEAEPQKGSMCLAQEGMQEIHAALPPRLTPPPPGLKHNKRDLRPLPFASAMQSTRMYLSVKQCEGRRRQVRAMGRRTPR